MLGFVLKVFFSFERDWLKGSLVRGGDCYLAFFCGDCKAIFTVFGDDLAFGELFINIIN